LLATPIQVEAKETTAQTAFSVSGKLTASHLELLECLNNGKDKPLDHVNLLTFIKPTNTGSSSGSKPCVTLTFKHTERTAKSGVSRHSSMPKTDLSFTFNNCIAEVDITIIDRICALLNPLPVCVIQKPTQNVWNVPSTAGVASNQAEYKMDIKVMSPSATIKLRFPMPDFRPQHDLQRTPWWKRNVRQDFLSFQLTDMEMHTILQSGQLSQKYSLECRSIDVFYYENENDLCCLLGRAGVEEAHASTLTDTSNWPRLVLQIFPEEKVDIVLEQNSAMESDIMNQSMYGNLIGHNTRHPGPFSAKRVIHQSDTPHVKSHHDDTEELIIPGDKDEINDFMEVTTQNCRFHLLTTLPIVSMQLVNKHIYEVIYNRINSDLLLWEPSAPKPKLPSFGRVVGEENDDHFLPMRSTTNAMYDSTMSVVSSSMESSLNSSMASSLSEASSRTRRKMSTIESDPTAEISHFQVRIASLALILLHEDLLTYSTDNTQTVISASVQQMQNTAKQFFDNLPFVTCSGNKDFENVKLLFGIACRLNHLRLLATPIQVEAKETTAQTAFSVSGKLTASHLELLECLNNGKDKPLDHVNLLTFIKPTNTGSSSGSKPCVTLTFKHTERTAKSGVSRHSSMPKTDLSFTFNNCIAEVDITIIDRICALLNPLPVCVIQKPTQNVWNVPSTAGVASNQAEYKMDIKVMSPSATIKLRFPMPDFRPQHDLQRTPWWKRNVRQDFLSFQLTDMEMHTILQSGQLSQKYSLECRSIDVFYYENENDLCCLLGRAGVEEAHASTLTDTSNWPRLVLQIFPEEKVDIVLEQNSAMESDIMNQSMYGNLIGHNTRHPGPFSAKRVIHQSDTPHVKSHHDDTEELIIPGDKDEINDFMEVTTQNCRFHLLTTLPIVSMQLVNKHIYEVIYNRINSDLLLWEPSAPKPKLPSFGRVVGEENDDHFLPMRSTTNAMYDSTMSVVSSSMESSLNSSMASSLSEASSRTRRKMSTIESDPTAEISHFQVRIASLALILLHEDLLTYSTDNTQTVISASVQQMQNTAKQFFDNLPFVTCSGNKDFENVKLLFGIACRLNHLR
ncbi:Atg2, partial [Trypoxylus dichotomus]